jgi:hypothetical protein
VGDLPQRMGGGCSALLTLIFKASASVNCALRTKKDIAEANVPLVPDIIPWMQEAIAHFYPDSPYAKSLPTEVRERARQICASPRTGARVTCPHCGASSPNLGRMEEIIAFVCSHCDAAVELESPKIQ